MWVVKRPGEMNGSTTFQSPSNSGRTPACREPWSLTWGEGPYLGATVRSLLNAESNEPWVCHSHQDVVNAVDVNAADAPALHVPHDVPGGQSPVKAPVPIWEMRQPLEHSRPILKVT